MESGRGREVRSGCVAATLAECLVLWFCVSLLCDRHRPSCVHPYRVGVPVVGRTVFRLPIYLSMLDRGKRSIPGEKKLPAGGDPILALKAYFELTHGERPQRRPFCLWCARLHHAPLLPSWRLSAPRGPYCKVESSQLSLPENSVLTPKLFRTRTIHTHNRQARTTHYTRTRTHTK